MKKILSFMFVVLATACLTDRSFGDLINEFSPNPNGGDPADTSVELLGIPMDPVSGWLLSVDTDFSPSNTIDRATAFTGTYDANGLFVATVPDFENPSLTLLFVDTFTGEIGDILDSTDDLETLGITTVFDAINTPDATGDEAFSIAGLFGGVDLTFSGDEPQLIFRDSADPSIIYSINDPAGTNAIDQDGNLVPFANFSSDPSISTFGAINPVAAVPEPSSIALLGLVGLVAVARRRK